MEVQVYADGSGIGGGVGAAAVLYMDGQERRVLRKYLGKDEHNTVFEAEEMGLTLAVELVRTEGYMESAEIGADSQAALCAIKNTKGASGQHLLDKFQDQIAVAQRMHRATTIKLQWTPGHNGIPGNERADKEAKVAANGDSSLAASLPKSCRGPMCYVP